MSFYWSFVSSFWRRAFLFFLIPFLTYTPIFLILGYFLGFGVCGVIEKDFGHSVESFPFWGVFIACLCVSFVVAFFEMIKAERLFCRDCLGFLEDAFVEGALSEEAFKFYYNCFKPLRGKWDLMQEEEDRREAMVEEQIKEIKKTRVERRDFVQKFKQGLGARG